MNKMGRAEALRKCLIVFDALRRVSSKGNAGLEAMPGAEESFRTDGEICDVLREWLREIEAGGTAGTVRMVPVERKEPSICSEWQKEIMEKGPPERLIF